MICRYWSLLLLCLTTVTVFGMHDGQPLNTPLDKDHPVVVTGDDSFSYNGKTYTLDDCHFLLDATIDGEVTQRSPYLCNSLQQVVERLKDGTPEQPMVVYIAPNVYWVDDPDDPTVREGVNGREPFGMTIRCQNLHLIGLSDQPQHVVLAAQRGQTQGAVGNFTMLDFHGDGLMVRNLTMGNYCNVDLEYPLRPSLGRKRRSDAITQAHVAYCHGDRVVATNVRFISRLNMNPLNGARRILFDHCHMESTDDALTGNGVYLHCDFEFYGQKPFYTTRQTGAVMLDCDFYLKSNNTKTYFCKSPGAVTLIDCRFHAERPVEVDWTAYPPEHLRCYYSQVTFNGQPYVVGNPQSTSVCLDGKEALKAFKMDGEYQIANLLAGDDGWCPPGYETTRKNALRSVCLKVSPNHATLLGDGQPLLNNCQQWRHGDYAAETLQTVKWSIDKKYENILHLTSLPDGSCRLVSDDDDDTPVDVVVQATTPDGLQGAMTLHLEGKPLPPPSLAHQPFITLEKDVATLRYRLSPDNHGDDSDISWFVADDKRWSHPLSVATSNDGPMRSCNIHPDWSGKYLMAVIAPRHARSGFGERDTVFYPKKLRQKRVTRPSVLETDFSNFPCGWQKTVKEGFWTVDGYKPADTAPYPWSVDETRPMWQYGEGFNGAVGKGLLQAQRGARMMYTPKADKVGNMRLTLDVDPTKTAGQGFGSATGQYMDVALKFDTRSLTGYALRIIRTTKYAKAVDFLLIRYDHGQTTPLTSPVSAICYRTGCHISVAYDDGLLTAHVTTDTPLDQPDDTQLKTEVSLSATVEPNDFGGFCLQHTGTCGESTTMLHHLRLEWE